MLGAGHLARGPGLWCLRAGFRWAACARHCSAFTPAASDGVAKQQDRTQEVGPCLPGGTPGSGFAAWPQLQLLQLFK